MMWRRAQTWIFIGCLAAAAALSVYYFTETYVDRNRVYRIGYNHNPPFQFHLPGKPPAGLSAEVVASAVRFEGLQVEWILVPEGPEFALRSGKIDIWPLAVSTPARQAEFYVSQVWLKTGLWLVRREDSHIAPDLAGGSVGGGATNFFKTLVAQAYPKAKGVPISDRIEILSAICAKRIDAGVIESLVMADLLLNRPQACDGVALTSSQVVGPRLEMGVMSSKANRALARLVREGIAETARTKGVEQIFTRWRLGFSGEGALLEALLEKEKLNDYLQMTAWLMGALLLTLTAFAWRIREARREAEQANRAKSDFLANMSHEIRTPMNGVLGLTELLLDSKLEAPQKDLADSIRQAGQNLLAILNDTLDLSKLEAGRVEIESIHYSLTQSLRTIENTLRPATVMKGITLSLSIEADLPEWLQGDPVRLSQVILNLGSNAIKFTDQGGVRIHVGRAADGDRLRIEIRDTGIGISPESGRKLFQPFSQADASTTRIRGGTGLGLAISRKLVDLMGGEMGWSSKPGEGSEFWFTLPLTPGVPVRPADPQPAPSSIALRILVAEDNVTNQRVVAGYAKRLGHKATVLPDGGQALEAWKSCRESYDVILMDCLMPVLDGWETTRRIREIEASNPPASDSPVWIIALTANAMEGDRERCLESGMDDYLSKPLSLVALAQALARIPQRRALAHSD